MAVRPRPLYRSRLLWLGVPGLVFLVWVWVDSFTNVSRAGANMWIKGKGFQAKTGAMAAYLQRGMVYSHRGTVVNAAPDIVVTVDPLVYEHRKGAYPLGSIMTKDDGRYGFDSMVMPLDEPSSKLALKSVRCWFPVWFVVAGYVVVWLGLLGMWRWWVWRRWRRSQVVEG